MGFLDRIWNVTSSRGFFALMLASLFIVPLYTLYGVYLSLENNLLFFSSVNVLMFVYGIFIIYLVNRLFPAKKELSRTLTYVLVLLSSVGMFVWYVPQVTLPAVTNPLIFTVMGGISVISGLLSGIVFRWHGDQTKMLYFEFITMMFSMLAIIIFYITAIGVTVIWPEFGVGQQLEFSLLLWGFTLPVMWLSTNLSLNADSRGEDISGTGSFLFTRRMKDQDWGKKSEGTEATQP